MTVLIFTSYYEFGSSGRPDVVPPVLGWRTSFTTEDCRVTVSLPAENDVLLVPGLEPEPIPEPGASIVMSRNDVPKLFAINYFEVMVEFEVDVSQAALDGGHDTKDIKELHQAVDGAARLSIETASRVRRWVFSVQPDLGPSEELPPRLHYRRIQEQSSGRLIPIAPTITLFASMRDEETALQLEFFGGLEESLAQLEDPPVPEALLAQARNLLIHQRGKAVQPELAVLLAAVAAEVKAKRVWENVVSDERRSLLDLALKNPQAFPQSAIELFDKVALAVAGRSFRLEDKQTYKQIDQLFQLRNRVAHAAAPLDEKEARFAVLAVLTAFAWLDALEDSLGIGGP